MDFPKNTKKHSRTGAKRGADPETGRRGGFPTETDKKDGDGVRRTTYTRSSGPQCRIFERTGRAGRNENKNEL